MYFSTLALSVLATTLVAVDVAVKRLKSPIFPITTGRRASPLGPYLVRYLDIQPPDEFELADLPIAQTGTLRAQTHKLKAVPNFQRLHTLCFA